MHTVQEHKIQVKKRAHSFLQLLLRKYATQNKADQGPLKCWFQNHADTVEGQRNLKIFSPNNESLYQNFKIEQNSRGKPRI